MDRSMETAVYEIRIQGHLGSQRAEQFEDMVQRFDGDEWGGK